MSSEGLRKRVPVVDEGNMKVIGDKRRNEADSHPGGEVKHGAGNQVLRVVLLALYFLGSCLRYFVLQ